MSRRLIFSIVGKDLILFSRDKFFGIMTFAVIIVFILLYFLMPKQVDETIEIGVHAPGFFLPLLLQAEHEGVKVHTMASEEVLQKAILDRTVPIGMSLPYTIFSPPDSGITPRVNIYYSSDLPININEASSIFISEMIHSLRGESLEIVFVEQVLGPDMAGKQIPFRDRVLPLMAFMVLVMETIGFATLIVVEFETGTIGALLTTPLNCDG